MYVCSICGLKKAELASNPEFEFRSRCGEEEDGFLEGISNWCSKCEALRFFFRSTGKEPPQYLEEQPKRKLANYMLEATVKDWQRSLNASSARQMDEYELMPSSRKVQLDFALPPQPRDDAFWETSPRSQSVDPRGKRHGNPIAQQRSKSMAHEPLRKRRQVQVELAHEPLRKRRQVQQEADRRRDKPKDVYVDLPKLSTLTRNSRLRAEEEKARERDMQRIDLEEEDFEPKLPIHYLRKTPVSQMQQLELVNPWQEEVQKRTNQLLVSSSNKKELKQARVRDERMQSLDRDTSSDIDAMGLEVEEDELNQKLAEKKNLVLEWDRIRVRVEGECDRVNAELAELAELKRQRMNHRQRSQVGTERQRGGAQFPLPPPPAPPSSRRLDLNELQSRVNDQEKTVVDELDEKLLVVLDTMQVNSPQVKSSVMKDEEEMEKEQEAEETDDPCCEPSAPPASETDFDLSDRLKESEHASLQDVGKKNIDTLRSLCLQKTFITQEPKNELKNLDILLSTVQRARFRSFPQDPRQLFLKLNTTQLMKLRDPPPAQFSTLPCHPNDIINLLQYKRDVLEPQVARPLKICRSPIFCPDADCRRMFFISDFNDHLTHEHPTLSMERLLPGRPNTFFLDTRVALLNKPKCTMVYFVRDKLFDHNSNKFPELFPVLVMTARLHMPELFNTDISLQVSKPYSGGHDSEIFVIWLTSLRPDDIKIIGTLAVWPTNSRPIYEYLTVQTSEVYNIRSSQKLRSIFDSNQVLALPGNYIDRITDGGNYLLAVQVLIH